MAALKDCLSKAVKGNLLDDAEAAFVQQKAASQTGMTRKEAELWAAKDMLRDTLSELDSIARQVGKSPGQSTRKSTVVLKTKDLKMAEAAMLEEHQVVAEKRIAAKREEERLVTEPQLQAEAELEAAAGKGPETIKAAAIRIKASGRVFQGPIHFAASEAAVKAGLLPEENVAPLIESGYVTSTGRFVSSKEALQVAKSSGQTNISQVAFKEGRLAGEDIAGKEKNVAKEVVASPAAAGGGGVTSFKTSKGSTYQVKGQTTQRTKSAHAGHKPGDVGLKEQSEQTVYVTPEQARELGMFQSLSSTKKRIVMKDGKLIAVSWNEQRGDWGADSKPIPFTTQPEVGKAPVELWKAEDTKGNPGFTNWHPGNEITEVTTATAVEKGAAAQTRTYEAMSEKLLNLIERNRQLIAERQFKEGMTIGGVPMTAAEMKTQGITEESLLRLQRDKVIAALGELNAVMKFMPPEVRGKAGGFFQLAKAKEPLGDILIERLERVQAELNKLMSADYRERITKLIEGAEARKKAGILKGTLGAEPQHVVDAVTKALAMTPKQASDRMNAIDAELAQGIEVEEGETTTPEEKELALREEWAIINSFSDLKNRSVEHLADVYHQLKDYVSEARKTWRATQQARIDSHKAMARVLVEGLPTVTGQALGRLDTHDVASLLRSYPLIHGNFVQFLRAILPETATFTKDWGNRVRRAENATTDAITDAEERTMAALGKAIGSESGLKLGSAIGKMKKRGTIQVTFSNGEIETMSQMEAIQYVLAWEQPDVRPKMEPYGYDEKAIDQMRAGIADPGSQAIINHLRQEYARTYELLNPVYQRMFGINMPRIQFYAPTRFIPVESDFSVSPFGIPMSQSGSVPNALQARVPHKNRMVRSDAMVVYYQHLAMVTHWAHHAELIQEMRAVLSNREVREAIKAKYGAAVDQQITTWIKTIIHQDVGRGTGIAIVDGMIENMITAKATSALGLNLRTIGMQLDSVIRWLGIVPARRGLPIFFNPRTWTVPDSWHSDTVQRRILNGGSPVARYLYDKARITPSLLMRAARVVTVPMQIADAYLSAVSAQVIYTDSYNQAKAANPEISEEEAQAIAADQMDEGLWRYSQPIGIANRALAAHVGGPLLKMLTLFQSDPMLKGSIIAESSREAFTGKGEGGRGMSLQRIAMVVTAGLISQTVANIARSIFTDDDWDEIWTIGGYAKATALAPLQGLFLWGTALDIGLSMILGAKWWMAPRDPAIEAMSRAYQAGKHIEDIVDFAHPEEMAKEWGHITRSFTLAAAIPGVSQAGAAMTAVPAAALNLVQQMVAGYQKATEEE